MALKEREYDRAEALRYARVWAYSRNPRYTDFENMGGDCTNFISQCLYQGSKVMNFTPDTGWYYVDINKRAPAWTGVDFLYKFLVSNRDMGPCGVKCQRHEAEVGDIIQLYRGGTFTHSLFITRIEDGDIYVATHTYDAYNRSLESYWRDDIRYIHITKVLY